MNAQRTKKIERLQSTLDAEIARRDLEVDGLPALLDACPTEQHRKNLLGSWNMQDRNQMARINNARDLLNYEIAKGTK